MFHDEVLLITTKAKAESEEFLVTKLYDVADLVVCRDSKGQPWDDYETLIDVITQTVAPKKWEQNGGQGTITGEGLASAKILVVSQEWQVHDEIGVLLKKIREVAGKKAGEIPRLLSAAGTAPPRERDGKQAMIRSVWLL